MSANLLRCPCTPRATLFTFPCEAPSHVAGKVRLLGIVMTELTRVQAKAARSMIFRLMRRDRIHRGTGDLRDPQGPKYPN